MTTQQLTVAVNKYLDDLNQSYINYQISFTKDGMVPLTFIEWVRVLHDEKKRALEGSEV